MNTATVAAHADVSPARRRLLPALLLALTLAWLWFVLCRQLSYEWSANEQYNYGWFVPFFAAFLFWLRYEDAWHLRSGYRLSVKGYSEAAGDAPGSRIPSPHNVQPITKDWRRTAAAALLLAALLPIRLFEVANPDWRPLSWAHALIVVGLTLLMIGYWGGKAAVRYFAFPVCFILVAVPWLTPIEAPLVQGLMRVVAAIATEALTLFGIPAQLEGNLIRVSNGVVGVSEACSGVRSLQTSLMIGLLFGELKRLSIGRRVALVAAALAIAFIANCGRAFFLVWIAATENLAAVERWHDLAGYAIVGLVFLGTIASASVLAGNRRSEDGGRRPDGRSRRSEDRMEPAGAARHRRSPKGERVGISESNQGSDNSDLRPPTSDLPSPSGLRSPTSAPRLPSSSFLLSTLAFLLLSEALVSGWYRWHERNFIETPRWTARWPESAPGFHNLPIDDNVRSTLRYDAGREGAWQTSLTTSPDEQPTPANITMFFFRWDPGSASILRARAHRPDICLPNTGWRMTHDDGVRAYAVATGFALPFRHFRFARDAGGGRRIFAEAFFCQREDRVPATKADRFDATSGKTGNWMRNDRVRVVREGLRHQGQQVLELVMLTPNELSRATAETTFAELLPGLVQKAER